MDKFERALSKRDKNRREMNTIIGNLARDIYEEAGVSEEQISEKEEAPPDLSDLILEEESRRNYGAWRLRQICKWEGKQ